MWNSPLTLGSSFCKPIAIPPRRGIGSKLYFVLRKKAIDPIIRIKEPSIKNLGFVTAELLLALAKRYLILK